MFSRPPKAKAGDAAPPFSLPGHDGKPVSLTAMRGRQRVVLTFYVEDDTAACARDLKALQDALPRFEALEARVLAVSHNASDSQARFARKLGLKFALLSDPGGTVASAYGAKGMLSSAFGRKTCLIDGRGVLRLVQDGPPRVDALEQYLEALRGDLEAAGGTP